MAVCAANESDQIEDIIKIIYKLRHTENAADVLPSTDYALVRLLLKFNETDMLMAIINDPVSLYVDELFETLKISQIKEKYC